MGGAKSYLTLVVRAKCAGGATCDAAAAALAPPVVAAVRSIDRNLPISAVQTMDAVVGDATAESRFYLVLLAAFAGIAIVLASVGIFGVMSYAVARRTHEIGIRVALGAEPRDVVRMIVGQGTLIALSGAAVGLGASLLLTRLMAGILYGVAPRDPATFGWVSGLLIAIAALASYLPARRAAMVDPLMALRSD
jgi:ABC-type antimicrobial peptide transport system permease subunit